MDKIRSTLNYWGRNYAVPRMNENEFSNFYDTYILELKDNAEKIQGYGTSYRLASLSTKMRDLDSQIFQNQSSSIINTKSPLESNRSMGWINYKKANQSSL